MIHEVTQSDAEAILSAASSTPGGMVALARSCGLSPQLLYQMCNGKHPRVTGATWDRVRSRVPALGSPSSPPPPSPADEYRHRAMDIAMRRGLPKEVLAEILDVLREAMG